MKLFTHDDLKDLSKEELKNLYQFVSNDYSYERKQIYKDFDPIQEEFDRKEDEFEKLRRLHNERKEVRDSEINKLTRITDYNKELISYYLDK